MVRIDRPSGVAAITPFLDLGRTVYRQAPWWPGEPAEYFGSMIACAPPANEYAEVQPFLAYSDEQPVARILAMRDYDDPQGHLFFFEALPEVQDAVFEMLDDACQWLAMRNCSSARLAFRPGWDSPLTIDAYGVRPTLGHRCNPPYYHALIKNCGFVSARSMVEYQVRFTPELLRAYRAATYDFTLRPFNFDRGDQEVWLFRSLINEAFAQHWGVPVHTAAELRGWTLDLKGSLYPGAIQFAEVDGEPAGHVWALPDFNDPTGKHACLFDIGVLPEFRNQGLGKALASACFLAMHNAGYTSASYTLVLDENLRSRRLAESVGCRIARNFVCYERSLS